MNIGNYVAKENQSKKWQELGRKVMKWEMKVHLYLSLPPTL